MATFVLVHGSWHGAWCWRRVADALRAAGHAVHAPTLTGCGSNVHRLAGDIDLTVHADDVANLLVYEDLRDVVLVGHSYAGLVVAAAAPKVAERIASLVYLDAYIVPPGGRGFDLWDAARVAAARAALQGESPYRAPLGPDLLGITDPALAEWVAARLTPHPLATYDEALPEDTPASAALPRLYIRCTGGPIAHLFEPVEAQVRAWGWPVDSLDTGHDAMLTAPDELTAMLLAHAGEARRPRHDASANHPAGRKSMTGTNAAADAAIRFRVKKSTAVDPAVVERDYVARFDELTEDPAIFEEDRKGSGARRHFHVISGDGVLPTAKIRTPHHFHVSYVELPPGNMVRLHAHDVPEVFIPMTGTFELLYGGAAEHSVVLRPLDTFSVPVGVMRTFRNIGPTTAIIMVIYDSPGDVLGKIFYDPERADDIRRTFGASGRKVVIEDVDER